MKILHIIDSGGLYGAENVLLDLMEEQNKQGIESVLCSIGGRNITDKPIEIEALKRNIVFRKFRMRNGLNIIGASQILDYAQRNHFDLIHSHGYKGDIFFGWMPRKHRGLPMVTTLHGWTDFRGLSKLSIYRYLQIRCLKNIEQIVAVSNDLSKNQDLASFHDKITVIRNGIKPLKFSHDRIERDKFINDFCRSFFIIGTIGRLSGEKGYMFLLQAMDVLSRKFEDIRLVILGEGPQRDDLQKYIDDKSLCDRVILPGYRPYAYEYTRMFDTFVLPSLSEGLPISLLEAMQARTPVIAARVGGIPEVIKDRINGILVNPMDMKSLIDAISYIYQNKDGALALGEAAEKTVLEEYSITRMTREYSQVYYKAIK